jgi:hypothetical protein
VLLKGQGLTIERPARSTGTAIGIGVSGIAAAIALALLARGLGWPTSFPQFLAYLGAAAMALVAVTFAFWTYACATMRYFVGADGVTIRWGPVRQHIPVSRIVGMQRGRGEQRPKVRGVGWMGYHVGRGYMDDYGEVLFYSTHRVPEDILYVGTPGVTYALSPQDPARFIADVHRAQAAGAESGMPAVVERDFIAAHPIWSDRPAQVLAAVAIVANAALWGFVFAIYPDLSNEITIEFPPLGDITTLASRDEILKIPATATAFLAVNLLASLVFQARERAATYLLLSGTVFFQVVFWVAAVVAYANA